MRKIYYLLGTIIGLLLIPFVAMFITLGNVGVLLNDGRVLTAVACGYLAAIAVAIYADRQPRLFPPTLFKTVQVLGLAYLAGAILGPIANFVLHGLFHQTTFGSPWEIEYFWKPAFALVTWGVPCAIVIALLYFLAARRWVR